MIIDMPSVLAYVLGLILTFAICRIFIKPLKLLLKLLINGIIGGFILAAVNFLGGFAGVSVIINPLSALIAGVLGVPGVILVILLQYIL